MSFIEQTLVIVKPDGVQRWLVGEICTRFERVWLKLVAGKLFKAPRDVLEQHYPLDRTERVQLLWERTDDGYKELGMDVMQEFGTDSHLELGKYIVRWLVDYMSEGEVFAMVLEWAHAIEVVRKLIGSTVSLKAAPGTIRWDYSCDSIGMANLEKRPIRNIIHASWNPEEAKFEVDLWFGDRLNQPPH